MLSRIFTVTSTNFQEAIAARSYLSEKPEIYGKSEEDIEAALKVDKFSHNILLFFTPYLINCSIPISVSSFSLMVVGEIKR